MKAASMFAAVALVVVAGGAAWLLSRGPEPAAARFVAADPVAGSGLYAANCASCHGADLAGAADWQVPGPDGRLPPPHDETGHTWHHGDQLLFDYTRLGGTAALAQRGMEFDSGMPGFAESLTDAEIGDILAFIKSTWPERVRDAQAARTDAEQNP